MNILSYGGIFYALVVTTFAEDVSIKKRELFQYNFAGSITDIARCDSKSNQPVLVLAQGNGVIVDAQWQVQKRFSFASCNETKVLSVGDGSCVVYCGGGGFSPVWSMDLHGREIWRYESKQVARVIPDLKGRYFICTMSQGVRILSAGGTQIDSLADDLSDIWFANPSLAWTISANGTQRYLERLEESFKVVRKTQIAGGAFRLVACQWPETNDVCYATYTHLICIGQDQRERGRIKFGGPVTSVNGVVVQNVQGSSYLALVARYKTATGQAKLLVVDQRLKAVYEEMLPTSKAIATLGMSGRFYVGVGATSVVEYSVGKGSSSKTQILQLDDEPGDKHGGVKGSPRTIDTNP